MLEIAPEAEAHFPPKEITEAIIGAAFEVHNQFGYGFLERVSAEIEKRIQVQYKGVVVGDYDADLIVGDCVAVEIKVSPQYDKRDEAQLLNELKATGLKVGVLLNFGRTRVDFKRLVF